MDRCSHRSVRAISCALSSSDCFSPAMMLCSANHRKGKLLHATGSKHTCSKPTWSKDTGYQTPAVLLLLHTAGLLEAADLRNMQTQAILPDGSLGPRIAASQAAHATHLHPGPADAHRQHVLKVGAKLTQ